MAVKIVGLARRLLVENMIDEARVQQAILQATQQDTSLAHYLVSNKIVSQYALAVTTSDEFQLPLIEIESLNLDYCPVSVINADLIKNIEYSLSLLTASACS